MKTSTKWMIGIAAALVLFFLLIFYSSEIYVWAMGKITTFVIWAVIFLAGFLIGRFGGRSRSPIRRVAIPGELTTANAMLLRFFPSIVDRTPVLFSEIAAAVERGAFDAGVLIHEGRFTYERHNLELVADLGALWEQQTGLPLPLGGIVASRELPAEVRRTFDRVLHDSIAYALEHPTVSRPFVREHARELDDEVIDRRLHWARRGVGRCAN